ncbi:MAG: peptidoglycan-binding protein [Rhodobiaceae bacterium]|nr:peptidoglycan-binding protein [Rhodobiaceae bacterium]MCC0049194.1 peptidoglycan-binding protein [Rhodobiaceae bacterium]
MDDEKAVEKLKGFGVPLHDPEEIQRLLANLGYDPGPVDGVIGRQVRGAIRAFEKDQGMKQTGAASFELQKKLSQEQRQRSKKSSGEVTGVSGSFDLEILD